MIFANMHNHSTFSDGKWTPEELVALAKSEGYGAVVLTDHDTIRGTYFTQKAARKAGLLTLLGCEFSTVGLGTDFHVVGYDFNPYEPEMAALLKRAAAKVTEKNRILLQWAHEKGDFTGITWDDVLAAYPHNDYYCREHVLHTLQAKGLMKERTETFKLAFTSVNKERNRKICEMTGMYDPEVSEVIRIVRKAGGVPVVAHARGKVQLVEQLIEMGLMGIEVNFCNETESDRAQLNELADRYGLYKTGGSDHGGVLGGFLDQGERYQCDPELCGANEEEFMKLYRRVLG